MSDWKERLATAVVSAETRFDQLRSELTARLGLNEPLTIQPYLGYGTAESVTIRGRVLENEGVRAPTDADTLWRNMLNAYRQLESDEIAGATVTGTFYGAQETAVTDEEGFFTLTFSPPIPPTLDSHWHDVALAVTDAPVTFDGPVQKTGQVLLPAANAAFGVISDIDDTVLQSSATNYLRAARLLFLHNARTRLPFAGVAAFYQALQRGQGNDNGRPNPIFYVSSSPWNIFRLLVDFFDFQDIPRGPLFLKDYGLSAEQFLTSGHRSHKLKQIDTILNTYPHLPFVLIGDSGQKDPEIYAEVALRQPPRIRAIYIRDVSDDERDAEVEGLATVVNAAGVPMLLTPDSYIAASHAADIGLIHPDALTAVAAAKAKEETEGMPLDELDA